MAWLPPPLPPTDGLPPLVAVPDSARLGLAQDQCALLTAACSGRHLFASGPGGSGKTMVLGRYASLRAAAPGPRTTILCITPDASSPIGAHATMIDPARAMDAVRLANAARSAGEGTCLIADEHGSVPHELAEAIDAFDQVIVTGDPAQGTYAMESETVRKLQVALGATSLATTTLRRSHNKAQFNTMNALAYQGRHEAVGWASDEAADAMRWVRGPPGSVASCIDLGLRAARNAIANPSSSIAVVVSTPEEMCLVTSVLAHVPFSEAAKPRIRFVHPAAMQGTEADVILCATIQAGRPPTRPEIEAFAFVLLGRARFRMELRRPPEQPEGGGDLDAWLAAITAWNYESVAPDPSRTPYAKLAAGLPETAEIHEGLTHLTVTDRKNGRALRFINLLGDNLRADCERATAAASKNWTVSSHHLEELGHDAPAPRRE